MSLRVTNLAGFGGRRDIVRSGLTAWLDARDFSSGQTWTDKTANANNFFLGTTSGADATDPTHAAGPPAYFSSDGGDFFKLTTAHSGELLRKVGRQDTPFTVEAWVYRGATANTDEALFTNGSPGAGADAISIMLDYSSNRPALNVEGGEQGVGTAQLAVGAWKHFALAGRLDGTVTCTWYTNGAANGTFTYNMSGWTTGDSVGVPNIGTSNDGAANTFQSGTRISIFRAYDRVLAAAEISQNFNVERGIFGV